MKRARGLMDTASPPGSFLEDIFKFTEQEITDLLIQSDLAETT